jgi:hypothetical protein
MTSPELFLKKKLHQFKDHSNDVAGQKGITRDWAVVSCLRDWRQSAIDPLHHHFKYEYVPSSDQYPVRPAHRYNATGTYSLRPSGKTSPPVQASFARV